ncbi:MAG: two component transcriptional regulator, LuxR family [Verrucomicrobiaceae bacterium]|nr:two component transcriptional regulator, LuxR family [Verrucomicrobiaceae bacterium]
MPSVSHASKARVVLVEDHPMFRERLAQMIDKDMQMTVAGEAGNILDGLRIIQEAQPDVIIVDISLKGSSGLDLIKELKARSIESPVLVLSMHSELLYAQRSLQAGARGYISKDEDSSQVMAAIRQVLAGQIYLSAQMNERVMQRFAQTYTPVDASVVDQLTDRELEVFRLFGEGLNTRMIAERLTVGENTVSTFRQRIKKKLNVKDFTELYCQAARWVQEQQA